MSTGGYESPNLPSSYTSYGSRRISGLGSGSYDRGPNGTAHRASPSPSSSRRFPSFDRSQRDGPSYQGEYSNSYRPSGANSYRPDYGNNSYYSRSPSPDRYISSRSAESDSWDRSGTWQSSTKWAERKVLPHSPTTSIARERSRSGDEMMATRMFEPSDAWKQTHVSRPIRGDSYRPGNSDHRYEYRSRLDSPERPRSESGSHYPPAADRYRPAPPRWDTHSTSRSEYNSYRPQYEGGSSWTPPSREPLSPSGSYRRDSLSAPQSRLSDRYEHSYSDRKVSSGSGAGSVSPHHRTRSPPERHGRLGRSSSRDRSYYSAYDSDSSNNRQYDIDDRSRRRRSRSTSRSSIASTQHSISTNPPLSVSRPESILPDLGTNGVRGSSINSISSQSATAKTEAAVIVATGTDTVNRRPDTHPASPNLAGNPLKLNGPILNEATLAAKPLLPSSKPIMSDIQHTQQSQINGKADQNIPTHDVPKSNSNTIDIRPFKSSYVTTPTSMPHIISFETQQRRDPPLPLSSISVHPQSFTPLLNSDSQGTGKVITHSRVDVSPLACTTSMRVDKSPPESSQVSPPSVDEDSSQTLEQSDSMPCPLPTEVPKLSEARSLKEALRAAVMTRLLCDRQSREARIDPVLAANLAIATEPEVDINSTPEQVIQEVYSGSHVEKRLAAFQDIKPAMIDHFRRRQAIISAKAEELKAEYISLQQLWNAHRVALNQQSKALNAAEQEQVPHTGRTTRRTANLGDAVRSDLEMEQIIASLGYDEATDPSILCLKNVATIPDMISVTHGKIDYYFDDTNNRVENPSEYYAPETGMHDWTEEEKETFVSKFAAHPKQFGIIADFLPNKTPAQCVAFYYLHKHNHIDFRKVVSTLGPNKRRRRGGGKRKSNALLTDIAQHDEQVGRDGAASPAGGRPRRGRKPNLEKPTSTRKLASAVPSALDGTPTATPTPEPDAKPKRGRGRPPGSGKKAVAAAAAAVILPSAAAPVSRAETSTTTDVPIETTAATLAPAVSASPSNKESPREPDQEPDTEGRPTKRVKRVRKVKSAAIINDDEVGTSTANSPAPSTAPTPTADVPTPTDNASDASVRMKIPMPVITSSPSIHWSEEDKKLFLTLFVQHGTNFKKIAASMPNLTSAQISTYYKRNREELGLDKVVDNMPKREHSPELSSSGLGPTSRTASTSTKPGERSPLPPKPKVNTTTSSTTAESEGKSKHEDVPPMASLTPPPGTGSSQEPKMPDILKSWGSIMSRERPPPPPPRHPPKPKQSSRRPQSMSEVHSPTSSPPQTPVSLPATPHFPTALPSYSHTPPTTMALPPRPTSGLPAKPATITTPNPPPSRHYPTANYAAQVGTGSSSSAGNTSGKPTTTATPMAVTTATATAGTTTSGKVPVMSLNRIPRTTGGYPTTTGTTPYQASAAVSAGFPPRQPFVYSYGDQRYPPVYGPPPPPRPPFTASPSTSTAPGTATGQKDGHPHFPIYPPGGPFYYHSSSG